MTLDCKNLKCCKILWPLHFGTLAHKHPRKSWCHLKIFSVECKHWMYFHNMCVFFRNYFKGKFKLEPLVTTCELWNWQQTLANEKDVLYNNCIRFIYLVTISCVPIYRVKLVFNGHNLEKGKLTTQRQLTTYLSLGHELSVLVCNDSCVTVTTR